MFLQIISLILGLIFAVLCRAVRLQKGRCGYDQRNRNHEWGA